MLNDFFFFFFLESIKTFLLFIDDILEHVLNHKSDIFSSNGKWKKEFAFEKNKSIY